MNLSEKGIIIRKTAESDLSQIYSQGLNDPAFAELHFTLTPENLADIFASENCICLSAVRKKNVLGFIIGSVNQAESKVHWMTVKENFRKAGIGTELLKLYTNLSKKYGADHFLIAAFKNNPQTVNFFIKNGFTEETLLMFHKYF